MTSAQTNTPHLRKSRSASGVLLALDHGLVWHRQRELLQSLPIEALRTVGNAFFSDNGAARLAAPPRVARRRSQLAKLTNIR